MTLTSYDYWRVVFALAAKDIVDAIKNKTTLTIILGLGMMMLTVEALPLLLRLDNRPRLAIYDADRSGAADELRRGGEVQVVELRTAEDAATVAREANGSVLAVQLPPGWEAETGGLSVTGYAPHWLGAGTIAELTDQAEQSLGAVTGRSVTVHAEAVYPTLENGGHTTMIALGLILATTLVTMILVPYLILEEKTTHTLEALRVSPVTVNQVLLGKGIAGLVYGVLAAAVLLAFNLPMINLWGVLIATVLAIVLFGVGVGLLVGSVVENEGAVQMWVGLLVILLMAPLMLAFLPSAPGPAWLHEVMAWLPATAAYDLVRVAFVESFPAATAWSRLGALLGAVVLVFAAAGWRLRRWEA
jgi:ABC-type multidrug transport system permease subunit